MAQQQATPQPEPRTIDFNAQRFARARAYLLDTPHPPPPQVRGFLGLALWP